MKYNLSSTSVFPLVDITLQKGEEVQIEPGSMVYHNGLVTLEGHMNSNGKKGLGGMVRALGRSLSSGESFFITKVRGDAEDAKVTIAPSTPGTIRELPIGPTQWRLNTGAFLASESSVSYTMQRQKLEGALLGGTGGLFVMETAGEGMMLINGYGDLVEITMDGNQQFVVDNEHVLAWSKSLDYHIEFASGTFGFKTGEGLVNRFSGQGKIIIQSRNIEAFASLIAPFIPTSNN
ncbi:MULTISPECIES: TIGR00266 family protein [Enterococcus]|jgi:uncharacterized protein (TIGR00266 family)|uniref:TIGR00266 family protein n=1 Tax=Enterococcus dispar ATCC 51266 TaxID=1139219 RepID=S1NXP9_9ENTE|nr:TIGR00266 family protein [Enterococcus dispar]EOT43699.1 TIGR00266 family protein [Enterococcus dispar ATCC 51266]EOW85629.1 TIGR00266 family protein [Enterococcus dispar ATCC 51266]MCU7358112.1 TIGR00266 family protein [Enterococcus dispar]MDT2705629.1 TIGR00266 family protein [Enterococcus dispar]OJG37912.1 TIGR00266 family protein [Enterococcus dispar]